MKGARVIRACLPALLGIMAIAAASCGEPDPCSDIVGTAEAIDRGAQLVWMEYREARAPQGGRSAPQRGGSRSQAAQAFPDSVDAHRARQDSIMAATRAREDSAAAPVLKVVGSQFRFTAVGFVRWIEENGWEPVSDPRGHRGGVHQGSPGIPLGGRVGLPEDHGNRQMAGGEAPEAGRLTPCPCLAPAADPSDRGGPLNTSQERHYGFLPQSAGQEATRSNQRDRQVGRKGERADLCFARLVRAVSAGVKTWSAPSAASSRSAGSRPTRTSQPTNCTTSTRW